MKKTPENGKFSHALLVGRINIVKGKILPKTIYIFNAMSILIPVKVPSDHERTILNFKWKNKKPKIAKAIMYNK